MCQKNLCFMPESTATVLVLPFILGVAQLMYKADRLLRLYSIPVPTIIDARALRYGRATMGKWRLRYL